MKLFLKNTLLPLRPGDVGRRNHSYLALIMMTALLRVLKAEITSECILHAWLISKTFGFLFLLGIGFVPSTLLGMMDYS